MIDSAQLQSLVTAMETQTRRQELDYTAVQFVQRTAELSRRGFTVSIQFFGSDPTHTGFYRVTAQRTGEPIKRHQIFEAGNLSDCLTAFLEAEL